MGSGEARQGRRSAAHTGSSESSREIAFSVKNGKIVTAYIGCGRTIVGYVYGGDDYHWKIVGSDLLTHLVHKSASLSFGPASYADEPRHEELERMVAPYRATVMHEHFGRAKDSAATSTT